MVDGSGRDNSVEWREVDCLVISRHSTVFAPLEDFVRTGASIAGVLAESNIPCLSSKSELSMINLDQPGSEVRGAAEFGGREGGAWSRLRSVHERSVHERGSGREACPVG